MYLLEFYRIIWDLRTRSRALVLAGARLLFGRMLVAKLKGRKPAPSQSRQYAAERALVRDRSAMVLAAEGDRR